MSDATTSEAGPSRLPRPPAPAFQPASVLPRAPPGGSLRNAAGADDLDALGANGGAGASNGTGPGAAAGTSGDGSIAAATPAAPVKPVHRSASSKNAIVYSAVQRRNPVLHAVKNVPTEIGDITADYQVGTHNGVLFLSLKYHRLHPEYIHQRIEKMKNHYSLRILLILCDVAEHQQSLRELTKIAIVNDLSTFVAWSNEEIAQYLTTFKQYENKSADTLKERVHQEYPDQLQHVLTSGKKVNKADAENLASQFGSFAAISRQGPKALAGVKGLGPAKVNTLVDAFTKPFLVGGLKRPREGSNVTQKLSGTKAKVPAVAEAGVVNAQAGSSKAMGMQAGDGTARADEDGDQVPDEPIGSPDWPSNPSDEEDDDQGTSNHAEPFSRSRMVEPSRSPGLSPEPRGGGDLDNTGDSGGAWRDPLEDEDDVDEGGGSKRKRTDD